MDVLTDALQVTGLANTVLCRTEFYSPWAVGVDPSSEVMLHFLREGTAWLLHESDPPRKLEAGDLMMVTRGGGHAICDRPDRIPEPLDKVMARMRERIAGGQTAGASRAVVLCAKYRFSTPAPHPVMSRLPPIIHLRGPEVAANRHLSLLLGLLDLEAGGSVGGSELVVPRLVDSLLVFVLRAWLESDDDFGRTWFAALKDSGVSASLSAIHSRPDSDWTLDELAAIARQSRATYARRFNELVGEPPIAYLTRWRMHLAAKMLSESGHRVERVAEAVGYESAAAFTKAFKRQFEIPPARYRVQSQPGSGGHAG